MQTEHHCVTVAVGWALCHTKVCTLSTQSVDTKVCTVSHQSVNNVTPKYVQCNNIVNLYRVTYCVHQRVYNVMPMCVQCHTNVCTMSRQCVKMSHQSVYNVTTKFNVTLKCSKCHKNMYNITPKCDTEVHKCNMCKRMTD